MRGIDKAQKAIEIVGKHSSCEGNLRLYNSLTYAEVDVNVCLPMLNELYNKKLSYEDVKNSITIKEFLSHWDSDIALYDLPDVKVDVFSPHMDKTRDEGHKALNQEQGTPAEETEFKFKPLHKVGIFVFILYLCVLYLNHCTSFNNEYIQHSEGILSSTLKTLNTIDTIVDPGNWLLGLPQLFFDSITWANVVCIIIFGIFCLIVTWSLLFEDEHEKYDYQPFIATGIVLLAIYRGYYGNPSFNLVWTALVPLTYIILVFLGSLVVRYEFKLFHPQNRITKFVLKIVPLIIWLFVYLL